MEWQAGPGQPTTEQMKKLWLKLETLPSLEALEQWPLLPVRGRHLRRLHKSSQVGHKLSCIETAGAAPAKKFWLYGHRISQCFTPQYSVCLNDSNLPLQVARVRHSTKPPGFAMTAMLDGSTRQRLLMTEP